MAVVGTLGRIAGALERIAYALETATGIRHDAAATHTDDGSEVTYANTSDTLARLAERELHYRRTGRRIPIDEPLPKSWTAHLTQDEEGL